MLNLTRAVAQSILIYPDNVPAEMTAAELFINGPARW